MKSKFKTTSSSTNLELVLVFDDLFHVCQCKLRPRLQLLPLLYRLQIGAPTMHFARTVKSKEREQNIALALTVQPNSGRLLEQENFLSLP